MLFLKKDLDEAQRRLERMLGDHRLKLGDDHEVILSLLYTQAAIHYARGDYDAALSGFESVLEDQRRVLGDRHEDVLKTLTGLGGVRHRRGEFAAAGEAFQHVLDTRGGARWAGCAEDVVGNAESGRRSDKAKAL